RWSKCRASCSVVDFLRCHIDKVKKS
uniref:Uncharacterized protein n=1 Tax=Ditylenchus dipsaci TaxID=166011 RepID=A0A915CV66_9BILA